MFRLLTKASTAAKIHMVETACELIQEELAGLTCRKDRRREEITSLTGIATLQRVREFSWTNAVEELKDKAPVTSAILDTLLPSTKKMTRNRAKGRKKAHRYTNVSYIYIYTSFHSCYARVKARLCGLKLYMG